MQQAYTRRETYYVLFKCTCNFTRAEKSSTIDALSPDSFWYACCRYVLSTNERRSSIALQHQLVCGSSGQGIYVYEVTTYIYTLLCTNVVAAHCPAKPSHSQHSTNSTNGNRSSPSTIVRNLVIEQDVFSFPRARTSTVGIHSTEYHLYNLYRPFLWCTSSCSLRHI